MQQADLGRPEGRAGTVEPGTTARWRHPSARRAPGRWPKGSRRRWAPSWNEKARAWNFALYSKHATSVTLLLYGPASSASRVHRVRLDPLVNKSGRVWHCWLADEAISGGVLLRLLGRRASTSRAAGLRFDPDKVLLDPYARAVFFPPAFDREAARRPRPQRRAARRSACSRPAGGRTGGRSAAARATPGTRSIYEMHVRGFTRRANSGVAAERRGTFAGVVDKIPYLLDLGVTVVELLPVFQRDPQERNYWGYMPLNFFAPHAQYAAAGTPEGAIAEMQEMVRALHEAGIEVVLDVVYNHTVEGNEHGPTYSYRGIDNLDLLPAAGRTGAGTATTRGPGTCCTRRTWRSGRWWSTACGSGRARCTSTGSASTSRRSSRAGPTGRSTSHDPPIISAIDADPDFTRPAADRRGVGPPELPAGPALPGRRVVPVERPVPRRGARVRARRPRHGRQPDDAPLRQRRPVPGRPARRVPRVPERELRHGPRRVLPVRPRVVQREAQPGQRRGRTPTGRTTTSAGTAATKATRARRRRCWRCAGGR